MKYALILVLMATLAYGQDDSTTTTLDESTTTTTLADATTTTDAATTTTVTTTTEIPTTTTTLVPLDIVGYANLRLQTVGVLPTWIQETQCSNPRLEDAMLVGWRALLSRFTAPEGYRIDVLNYAQSPDDPRVAIEMAAVINLAEEAAEQAAIESQAKADAEAAKLALLTPQLMQEASLFRATLRRNFGMGAETNKSVTAEAVASYFEMKRMVGTITALETADAVALLRYFADISAWTGDGTTWSFRWDLVP